VATPEAVIAVAERAEALGYDSLWTIERLLYPVRLQRPYPVTPDGSLPEVYKHTLDPLEALTFAAARTKKIALGTSVIDMPYYNPVLLARRLTTLDFLSNGRLRVGLGIGWSKDEVDATGGDFHRRGAMAEEGIQVLKAIWTTNPVKFQGKFYRVPESYIGPKPVQKPHPPIRIAANSPDTFAIAGKLGLPIFASPLINPPEKLREYLAVHRETLKNQKQDVALAFPVHVSQSREQARRECEASLMHFFSMAGELIKPLADAPVKTFEAYQQLQERVKKASFESVDRNFGIFGDPDYCAQRIKAVSQDFAMEEFIAYFNQGGLIDHATVKRSMELFAREVIPQCK
jgi:probable F420-dependent oxidoreductase